MLAPVDGATVSQATDAIILAPYSGTVALWGCISLATSPQTVEEYYGQPPGTDLGLHDLVGEVCAAPRGTIFRLAEARKFFAQGPLTLTPGTYYFRVYYSYFPPGVSFQTYTWGPVRRFVIAPPAPPPQPVVPPVPQVPLPRAQADPAGRTAACARLAVVNRNASKRVRQARVRLRRARPAGVSGARAEVRTALRYRTRVHRAWLANCSS